MSGFAIRVKGKGETYLKEGVTDYDYDERDTTQGITDETATWPTEVLADRALQGHLFMSSLMVEPVKKGGES